MSSDNTPPGNGRTFRLHPLTAAGGVMILVAAAGLLSYALLTIPLRQAAASGPPADLRAAATRRALQISPTPVDFTAQSPVDQSGSSSSAYGDSESDSQPGLSPTLVVAVPSDLSTPTSLPRSEGSPDTTSDLPDWVEVSQWLSIPRIDLEAPVMAFDPRSQDDDGRPVKRLPVPHAYLAAWDSTSAQPGFTGNTIMTGHNNLWGAVFKRLDELEPGDEISVWSEHGVFTYQVTETLILEEEGQPFEVRFQNAQYLEPSSDDRLTLVTCWPRNGSSHRLIVIATR